MENRLNKVNWVCYPNKTNENFSNIKQNIQYVSDSKQNPNTLKSYLDSHNISFDKIESLSNANYLEENRLF